MDYQDSLKEMVRKVDTLDSDIEDIVLDMINIAEIDIQTEKEFDKAKDYLKGEVVKAIYHVKARFKKKELFDRDL